jgi:hypothetical protein
MGTNAIDRNAGDDRVKRNFQRLSKIMNGRGTVVTSVVVTEGSLFAVSPSPAASGDVSIQFILLDKTPNTVFAGPTGGSPNPPDFRALVTADFANDVITYPKIQNVTATDRVLGRVTAGAGDIEEIVCTAAGRALIDDTTAAAQRTTLGLGTIALQDADAITLTGLFTINLGKTVDALYDIADFKTGTVANSVRLQIRGVQDAAGANRAIRMGVSDNGGVGRLLRFDSGFASGTGSTNAAPTAMLSGAVTSSIAVGIRRLASQTGDMLRVFDDVGSTGQTLQRIDAAGSSWWFASGVTLNWTTSATDATSSATKDLGISRSGAGTMRVTDGTTGTGTLESGDHKVITVGKGLYVKEGSNATMGVATLVAGTVTVNTTKVTANSRIMHAGQNSSGTHGELTVSARTAGTSFTITSTSATDTRDVAWIILEPA